MAALRATCSRFVFMNQIPLYGEKCLLVKEKWGFV
jgi:hypothetical protein